MVIAGIFQRLLLRAGNWDFSVCNYKKSNFTLAGKFHPADGIPLRVDRKFYVVSQHFSCHGNESRLLNCSSNECYFDNDDAGVQCLNG